MSLKVPFVGLVPLFQQFVAGMEVGNTCHLFQNDYTPIDGSILSNFLEASFDGYAPVDANGWSDPLFVSPRALIQATACNYAKSAGSIGNLIYGYYILDQAGNLLWAERDPSAPVPMNVDGNVYVIVPRLTIRSEF